MFRLLATILITIIFANVGSYATETASNNQTVSSYDIDEDLEEFNDIDISDFETKENKTTQIYDPLEKFNRKVYKFNDKFDRYFLKHVAIAYRKATPKAFRTSIHNFIDNIYSPVTIFNSILQGKVDNSLSTLSNFIINTTIGLGGFFNVAGKKNINYNKEDFGQVLGHYDVGSGAYLVLPFWGPSSARDTTGLIVDKSINPLDLGLIQYNGKEYLIKPDHRVAITAVTAVDIRESLIEVIDGINHDSFDPYATIRSAYLQRRQNEIKK